MFKTKAERWTTVAVILNSGGDTAHPSVHPMTVPVLAADVSVYGGNVSADQWRDGRNMGIGLAIVGLWHGQRLNQYAHSTLYGAQAAGLPLAAYVALSKNWSGSEQVAFGKKIAGDKWDNLRFVALDIELPGITQTIIADAAEAVRADGLRPIIYTGKWFWDGHLGNPDWFPHIPLWDSLYDQRAIVELVHPYGGWTSVVGKQFDDKTSRLASSADISAFDAEWIDERNQP